MIGINYKWDKPFVTSLIEIILAYPYASPPFTQSLLKSPTDLKIVTFPHLLLLT